MTRKQKTRCHTIIHSAATAAGAVGAGLAQIPGGDAALIAPIQILMIISLGTVFNINVPQGAARAAAFAALGTMFGRGISRLLVSRIPVWGNVVNATTAAVITETLGWSIANEMSQGNFP